MAVNQTEIEPVKNDYIANRLQENIGDISITDHGIPFDSFMADPELYFDEFDMMNILKLADKIKQSNSLMKTHNNNLPMATSDLTAGLQYDKGAHFSLEDTYLAYDLRESYL